MTHADLILSAKQHKLLNIIRKLLQPSPRAFEIYVGDEWNELTDACSSLLDRLDKLIHAPSSQDRIEIFVADLSVLSYMLMTHGHADLRTDHIATLVHAAHMVR